MQHIPWALTYDDVLIRPRRTTLRSRSEANTRTRLTKKININVPLVSANMETVTESDMAIAMARLGGIGIIHRFMTIEDNVEEIKRVKRAQNFIVRDPYTVRPDATVEEAKKFADESGVSGLLVTDGDGKLQGILSARDFLFSNGKKYVHEIMTPREKVIVGGADTTFEEAKAIMAERKVEKLPLVDADNKVVGITTIADIRLRVDFPMACTDEHGQLLVGGAIGVHGDFMERAAELIRAGADVLVIDVAHGHSDMMFDAVKKVREKFSDAQIIAGNIATGEATKELCEAGVDAVKVGVGPGTICITRLVTGCGVPQLTAVMECAEAAKPYGVPVIADGGIQKSGDIVKAIGGGADTIMSGSLFAGTYESPGALMNRDGRQYKVCRGSASFAVAQRRQKIRQDNKNLNDVVPEGVEALTPYRGMVKEVFTQLIGGLKSGMSYTNSHTIEELQKNVEFVRITPAGQRESGPHDLQDVK